MKEGEVSHLLFFGLWNCERGNLIHWIPVTDIAFVAVYGALDYRSYRVGNIRRAVTISIVVYFHSIGS